MQDDLATMSGATLGRRLRGLAHSAIDLSDGLLGDLGHILRRSSVGAVIELDRLPRSAVLAAQSPALQRLCLLQGGDDYELLFSAAAADRQAIEDAAGASGVAVSRIGCIDAGPGLRVVDADGQPVEVAARGFDHFA